MERSHVGNLSIDRRIILEWIFKKQGMKVGNELKWLRTRSNGKPL
jgi:hypothetical protein